MSGLESAGLSSKNRKMTKRSTPKRRLLLAGLAIYFQCYAAEARLHQTGILSKGETHVRRALPKKDKKSKDSELQDQDFSISCQVQLTAKAADGLLSQVDFVDFVYAYCTAQINSGPKCSTENWKMTFAELPQDIQLLFATSACPTKDEFEKLKCVDYLIQQGELFGYSEEIEELCGATVSLLDSTGLLIDLDTMSPAVPPAVAPIAAPVAAPAAAPVMGPVAAPVSPPVTESTVAAESDPEETSSKSTSPEPQMSPIDIGAGEELAEEDPQLPAGSQQAQSSASRNVTLGSSNDDKSVVMPLTMAFAALAFFMTLIVIFVLKRKRSKTLDDESGSGLAEDVSISSEASSMPLDDDVEESKSLAVSDLESAGDSDRKLELAANQAASTGSVSADSVNGDSLSSSGKISAGDPLAMTPPRKRESVKGACLPPLEDCEGQAIVAEETMVAVEQAPPPPIKTPVYLSVMDETIQKSSSRLDRQRAKANQQFHTVFGVQVMKDGAVHREQPKTAVLAKEVQAMDDETAATEELGVDVVPKSDPDGVVAGGEPVRKSVKEMASRFEKPSHH